MRIDCICTNKRRCILAICTIAYARIHLPKYFCAIVPKLTQSEQFWQLFNGFYQHYPKPVNINLHQTSSIRAAYRQKWVQQIERLAFAMTALCKTQSSCGSKPPMSNRIIRSRRHPQFLRSACPQLGVADAPSRDCCPLV